MKSILDYLIPSVEKFVELSEKTADAEEKVNLSEDNYEELMEGYIDCVKRESEQAIRVRNLASSFFGSDKENWILFLKSAWDWAQSFISREEAILLLNKAVENHNH